MIERGLLLAGVPLPGTDRVLRDPAAWWPEGHHSTRSRQGHTTDLFVLHWTAGHPKSDGREVYRAMCSRESTRRPGQPLDVAVNLICGWDGSIWQTADLATACVHVGDRGVIRRSVSAETRWPGTRRQAERLGVDGAWASVRIGGRLVEVMLPSQELREAVRWLAETLATHLPIPRAVPASAARLTPAQQRAHRGGQEHAHVPGSTKIDCAGLLVGELAEAGWARAA